MKSQAKNLILFFRPDNPRAVLWRKKIISWIKRKHPTLLLTDKNSQALLVLGGDGAILEAVQKYQKNSPVILGFNLGHTGFLASVREPKLFLKTLDLFLKEKYRVVKRMMAHAEVLRKGKKVFSADSLNEISVQNFLGMVELDVLIDGHVIQHIRGTGVLVATATGSTAYNLSAHGPIVMPDIKCMIVTEILDHNIPTPSIVVKRNREIMLIVKHFRKRNLLNIAQTGAPADVVIVADGESIFPLEEGDTILIRRSPGLIKFAEFDRTHFFKSLQSKFAFK